MIINKLKLTLASVVFITLFDCTQNGSDHGRGNSTYSKFDNRLDSIDYNILTYDSSYSNLFSGNVKATSISPDEIMQCETLIESYIKRYNEELEKKYDEIEVQEFKINLKTYGRQYIAVQHDRDGKII